MPDFQVLISCLSANSTVDRASKLILNHPDMHCGLPWVQLSVSVTWMVTVWSGQTMDLADPVFTMPVCGGETRQCMKHVNKVHCVHYFVSLCYVLSPIVQDSQLKCTHNYESFHLRIGSCHLYDFDWSNPALAPSSLGQKYHTCITGFCSSNCPFVLFPNITYSYHFNWNLFKCFWKTLRTR